MIKFLYKKKERSPQPVRLLGTLIILPGCSSTLFPFRELWSVKRGLHRPQLFRRRIEVRHQDESDHRECDDDHHDRFVLHEGPERIPAQDDETPRSLQEPNRLGEFDRDPRKPNPGRPGMQEAPPSLDAAEKGKTGNSERPVHRFFSIETDERRRPRHPSRKRRNKQDGHQRCCLQI